MQNNTQKRDNQYIKYQKVKGKFLSMNQTLVQDKTRNANYMPSFQSTADLSLKAVGVN